MSRRLVAFVTRAENASPGPFLYPATANVNIPLSIQAQRAPDPPRAGDFNTRVSRYRFFHGGSALSLFILREGYERSTVRAGFPRQYRLGLARGEMLPVRNPSGNSKPAPRMSWGSFLDAGGFLNG